MAKQLDLLLINPNAKKRNYQLLAPDLSAVEPPIWAGLIASFALNKGFSVEILDADALNLDSLETAKKVEEFNPLLTAIVVYGHQPSASTQIMPAVSAICNGIKNSKPSFKILLLGGHVASLPERTLNDEAVDYVCDCEGPITVVELLQGLKSHDISNVRGIWYKKDSKLCSNKPAPNVTNLDQEIPSVPWGMLSMDKYRAHNWHCFGGLNREPYASIYTSLGCPFNCSFCCIHAPFKRGEQVLGYKKGINSYRLWSPKSVINQIGILVKNYGVKNIKFADEIFIFNKEHVTEICDLIIERGYDLNIWAYARIDTIKEALLEKIKRAGISWLALGIESGNQNVRKDIHKSFRHEKLMSTVSLIRQYDINIIGNYIFGLPEDNFETMQETLDLAIELNCEFANFYSAMAYPGSKLYDFAILNKWPLPEKWSGFSQHSEDCLPLPTKYLSGGEVLKFRDQAFHKYFSNPNYLNMLQKKFGDETVNHIKKMTLHNLKRDNY